jgi:hypothetical protein
MCFDRQVPRHARTIRTFGLRIAALEPAKRPIGWISKMVMMNENHDFIQLLFEDWNHDVGQSLMYDVKSGH